jgi:hypothetical protein
MLLFIYYFLILYNSEFSQTSSHGAEQLPLSSVPRTSCFMFPGELTEKEMHCVKMK